MISFKSVVRVTSSLSRHSSRLHEKLSNVYLWFESSKFPRYLFRHTFAVFAVSVDQVVDEENSQGLANASMDVNVSMIDLENDEDTEDDEYEELTRE